jgi:hypothetical protein
MGELPKSRYLKIESFHLRPGKEEHFVEGARIYQEAYKNLNIEKPWVVYQITSGAPSGTFLIFEPMDSLKDMDGEMDMQARLNQAVGDRMKDLMRNADTIFASMQTDLYRLNPKTSVVSKEFASVDPSFWTPRAKEAGEGRVLARADFTADENAILRAQQTLNQWGYHAGSSDGILGSNTKSALRQFQKDKGLPMTGMIDRATAKMLGITH